MTDNWVHQQKRQVFNLSFLLVHLKGTSTRHSRNIGYRKCKKCRRSHSRKRILPRVPASGKRRSHPKVQKVKRFSTCLFCWCTLRGRVRDTAVTLAIGNVKSAVVRIRVSEYCRGFPQAGNGKVSRRCKMSRGYKTCLFCWCILRGRVRGTAVTLPIGKRRLNVKCCGVKKNTSTFILEQVVFYVLNYNFEQNLGSLLTLYVIYVIMFKKK